MRKAYLCWFGLVLSSQLFFVARQRPDILRHSSHIFLGAVLDSVRTVLLFLELFGCFMGMNVQTIRCLLQLFATKLSRLDACDDRKIVSLV